MNMREQDKDSVSRYICFLGDIYIILGVVLFVLGFYICHSNHLFGLGCTVCLVSLVIFVVGINLREKSSKELEKWEKQEIYKMSHQTEIKQQAKYKLLKELGMRAVSEDKSKIDDFISKYPAEIQSELRQLVKMIKDARDLEVKLGDVL